MIYIVTILLLVLVYVVFTLVVFAFQKDFIFAPVSLDDTYKFDFDTDFKEIWLEKINKTSINCLHFTVNNPKGVVLYHHGNSKNLQHWAQFHKNFTSRGYDIFFYDYRTFGKSKGKLTEASLYRDARTCYNHLLKNYKKEDIYQYGRSLGSAIATRMTRRFGSKFLILETPYLSMKAMAKRQLPFLPISWILNFQLRQDLDIKLVKCPILIITGTEDELTPHNHSLELSTLNKNVELSIIKDGTHNGLPEYGQYQEALNKYFGEKI